MIGEIQPAPEWTSERLEWIEINKDTRRTMQQNNGYELPARLYHCTRTFNWWLYRSIGICKGTELRPEKNIGKIAFSSLKLQKTIQNQVI